MGGGGGGRRESKRERKRGREGGREGEREGGRERERKRKREFVSSDIFTTILSMLSESMRVFFGACLTLSHFSTPPQRQASFPSALICRQHLLIIIIVQRGSSHTATSRTSTCMPTTTHSRHVRLPSKDASKGTRPSRRTPPPPPSAHMRLGVCTGTEAAAG
jgi:hypothetical protein